MRFAGKVRFFGTVAPMVLGLMITSLVFAQAAQNRAGPDQPPPISPEEGRKQARELVDNLLRLKPQENVTQNLLFKITDRDDNELGVPVRFQVICRSNDFLSVYETIGGNSEKAMKLTIVNAEGKPNQYELSQLPSAPAKTLEGAALFIPFAGSDFSIADLGLDFLHWPQQRILKKQMRKSVFCDVLESANPNQGSPYSKVVSWIGANHTDELVIVHAEAFDHNGKLLKQFDPRKLEKVNGVYQLEEMEIRNRQTGSSTKVEFQLK